VTPGVKQGLWYVFTALLNEGEEVLTPEPSWVSYSAAVSLAGGKLIQVPTAAEDNYFPSKEQWEQHITPKTRLILLNTPCNPTGRVYSKEELTIVAELAKEHDLIVVSDEVYARIIFDSNVFISIAALDGMRERTIVANGFSKAYAMPGFRVGYLAGPAPIIDLCGLINQHTITCVGAMNQHGALAALTGRQDWVNEMVVAYEQRRDYVVQALRSNEKLHWHAPEGTFYGWIDLGSVICEDPRDISQRLLKYCGIVAVSGDAFGQSQKEYVRVSFAVDDETVVKAADILAGLSNLPQKY